MKSFYLKSLGCKQNALEGQIIVDNLTKAGFKFVEDIQKCDFYILNSCTVTSHSDSTASYLLKKAKRENENIKTVLVGCLAQTYKEHKGFDYSIADIILGNKEKMDIEKYLSNQSARVVEDIFKETKFKNKFLYNPMSTRLSIKIQDGCNNRCSYCIIPYARGNSCSNSVENIIKQINIGIEKGIKEIVLTGIHIGQWKQEEKGLCYLLEEIEKTDIQRYRLGSLYINEIDEEMINILKNSKKFCPHFHLSLQSMCNKTLKAMNRSYSVDEIFQTIENINKNFHLPYLGSDIIVGFPNESEEDFIETFNNLKKAKLSSIHCFPYSRRQNTKAYDMENQIQDSIKTKRAKIISDLSDELHKNFLQKNQNEKAEILIERKSPKTGLYSALTRNYIKIYFKSDNDNLRHNLKMVELKNYKLH